MGIVPFDGITRRCVGSTLVAGAILLASAASAQAPQVMVLGEVAKALGHAADAVAKIGKSVAELVKLGTAGWDSVSARMTRQDLIKMAAGLSQLAQSQGLFISSIEDYVREWRAEFPSGNINNKSWIGTKYQFAWNRLSTRATDLLPEILNLLTKLNAEKSDFVLQEAYLNLLQGLQSRSNLIEKLKDITPPFSTTEIDALEQIGVQYYRLHTNLKATLKEVNLYVSKLPRT